MLEVHDFTNHRSYVYRYIVEGIIRRHQSEARISVIQRNHNVRLKRPRLLIQAYARGRSSWYMNYC